MNRILLACMAALVFLAAPAHGDIIPKDMKPIYVSAILTNMDTFPEYVFVQLETMGDEIRRKQVIGPRGSFMKGYKLNRLEILAVPRALFEKSGGLDALDLLHDPAIRRSVPQRIESGQELVSRPSSVAGKEVFYRIAFTGTGLELEKTGEKEFRDHPNHYPVNLFPYAFIITFAVELLVFFILVKLVFPVREAKAARLFLSVLAAQVATLPLLWLIITRYNLMGTLVMLGAESFAVAVETAIYRFLARLTWQRAFIAALICNGASYVVGMMA